MKTIFEILQSQLIFIFIVKCLVKYKVKLSYYLIQLFFVLLAIIFELIGILDFGSILLYIPVYFVLPFIYIKYNPRFEILFLSLYSVGFTSFLNSTFSFLVLIINLDDKTNTLLYYWFGIIYTVTTIIFFSSNAAKLLYNNFTVLTYKVKTALLILIWSLFLGFTALTSVYLLNLSTTVNWMLTLFIIVVLMLSVFFVVALVSDNLKNVYYGNVNKTIESNVRYQKQENERLKEKNSDLRKFKHDFENYMLCLNAHLNNNDVAGAKECMMDIVRMSIETDLPYNTGSFILNALLSQKSINNAENNIDIVFDGYLPNDAIDDMDLCTILGNALDNAIEACLKIDRSIVKTISLSVKQRADMLFISMSNPSADTVRILNNHVNTTKQDPSQHGIGLYSIQNVAKKYNGNMYLKYENGYFYTDIELQIRNSMQKAQ